MRKWGSMKASVIALHAKGLSANAIASELKCNPAYVRAAIQRHKCGGSRPSDLRYARAYGKQQKKHVMRRVA